MYQEHQLQYYVARHDPLTGLPNRLTLEDARTRARTAADGSGEAGLKEAARRLRRAVREEDDVARLGGDAFVLVVTAPMAVVAPPGCRTAWPRP
ncbi:protein of unknown function [Candidatus Hydrogenisulfobacillus filiaventi]|uniref:GGDEF domain-containing protein n=1 Tax=Candidatus Hydrogenisulfobacillus filiaventi TaxID=2707344 RepID=A0A6F8ZD96_9FIRM|nr:protein of unknown function [Candidatus Hydrogenisulfobacillus filiaventi]